MAPQHSHSVPETSTKTSVSAFCVDENSRIFIATHEDNTNCTIWYFESYNENAAFPLRSHTRVIVSLAVQDHYLFSGAHDKIALWDLTKKTLARNFEYPPATAYALLIWDADRVISSHYDKLIRIWDRSTAACCLELAGHQYKYGVRLLARWNDVLLSGGENVRMWNVETGECLRVFEMEATCVYRIAVNENTVAASSMDGVARVWNVESGELLATLAKHDSPVGYVQMDVDYIVTGAADGSIGIWAKPTLSLVHFHPGTNFTTARCTPFGCVGGIAGLGLENGTMMASGWEGVARIARLTRNDLEFIDVDAENCAVRHACLRGGRVYLVMLKDGKLSVEVWEVEKLISSKEAKICTSNDGVA